MDLNINALSENTMAIFTEEEPQIRALMRDYAVGTYHNMLIIIWRTEINEGAVDHVERILKKMCGDFSYKFCCLMIFEKTFDLNDFKEPEYARLQRVIADQPRCYVQALVVAAGGLSGWIARMKLRRTKSTCPRRVTSTTKKATVFMCEHFRETIEPTLYRAIALLRGQFRQWIKGELTRLALAGENL